MTNQRPEKTGSAHGMSRTARGLALALMAASIAAGAGCVKKKKPAPPPPPPPKPKVVIPDPVDVNAIGQQLHADARVNFPSANAPADRTLAEGVIKLANALAKGDAALMKPMLDKNPQGLLDALVGSGGWADGPKPNSQVRIIAVPGTTQPHPATSLVGTAIQDLDGAYLLAWHGRRDGDSWVFSAAPCQADQKPRASDFDGVSISGAGEAPAPETAAKEPKASASPSRPSEKKAPDPTPAKDPNGPIKKNTPAGPITIPRPPSPGGG